jgi:hypothetical protein
VDNFPGPDGDCRHRLHWRIGNVHICRQREGEEHDARAALLLAQQNRVATVKVADLKSAHCDAATRCHKDGELISWPSSFPPMRGQNETAKAHHPDRRLGDRLAACLLRQQPKQPLKRVGTLSSTTVNYDLTTLVCSRGLENADVTAIIRCAHPCRRRYGRSSRSLNVSVPLQRKRKTKNVSPMHQAGSKSFDRLATAFLRTQYSHPTSHREASSA